MNGSDNVTKLHGRLTEHPASSNGTGHRETGKPAMSAPGDANARLIELELQLEMLRRSNEELLAAKKTYALLYDFAPVGCLTLDRDGKVRTVNQTGANMLLANRAELVNLPFDQFIAEEDRSLFAGFLTTVFANRDKNTCRLRLSNDDCPPLYVRIEAMATAAGEECHVALIDITERKQADEALRESEYNLAKAQTMTHVGSWRSNPQTGELIVSDEMLRILHLNRNEVSQEAFASVVHPEDFQSVMDHLRFGAEQGKNYEIEHRLLLKDGTFKWVYTTVEPSVDHSGRVVRLYGTTQDITERKQTEVELRSQKNELQAIFDSINDGVIVFDHDGRVQHFNNISLQLLPHESLPGKTCRDLFHPETVAGSEHCAVERALRGSRVETSLVSVRDGHKIRYIDITATPIEDALGEQNRALVVLRDVTEKRFQELQLIQSDKMSSIGVLATGVAHEINNPLTSVAGYAEALLRRFRDDEELAGDDRLTVFPKYLNVIVRESYHCKGIIDSLLNFGRKSTGFVYNVDINGIIGEILELLRHQSSEERIDVVTSLKETLPPVHGDPSGLRQVIMNLLINAHQAIDGGGVVEIATDHSDDKREVYIRVSDTGCGIAPDIIDQIWDPFFTTKDAGKGLGLGLAISYTIVKRHGGEISLTSSIGKGSLFTVVLPVSRNLPDRGEVGDP
jgi:PAS domain S-box-containing protein